MAKTPTPADVAASRAADASTHGGRIIREKSTGARSIIRSLQELGVEVVFGLPGGAILPTYDPLFDAEGMKHILVRHEQGAGHAAEGYAVATGKVGVCIVTSGPAATNLVTPLLDANMDSIPMVAITGQVGVSSIGTDAFQEADIVGATMPVTKHSFLITNAAEIPARIAEAFYIASTGRPGPVLVDVTRSAQVEEADFVWPPVLDLPGYHPVTKPNARQVREAARLLATASRPVLMVGGGAIRSGASDDTVKLADMSDAAVVTTMNARGAVPDSHPHNLGMPGMHGTVAAVAALQNADLIVALGSRFDDRVTGSLAGFAPEAKVVHVDIDPAEISKNRDADVPIVGDLKETTAELVKEFEAAVEQYGKADLSPWWERLDSLRETYKMTWDEPSDEAMAAQYVVSRIGEIVGGDDVIYVTGVGQHQMWATHFLPFERPRQWISSGGAGTMGYGVPAGMGAKQGCPEKTVWVIDGDGSFQMTNQELATCRLNGINIKVAIINNSSLGMVRQWQTLFYEQRYSHTELDTGMGTARVPDFVKLGEAYDCAAWRVEDPSEVDDAIRKAMEINDRPVVIDFVTSPNSEVWPMVPAGLSNDQIMYAREIWPILDDDNA
ncbi:MULTISPECIES: acetolactate synthase large subunit [unclassified Actinobaculum]|uniref:acetolactate synthase large subunit n=1 Tax=unclassified Actinobaculum TaxID=2609299 RepID=UPI000D529DF8|nr:MULTISPECIES: acetolactate synthase large subunit [unclassified Actinobaculum]AWE42811.1 acetolactate synthase large subunit [Actinobaculum sp. 313]RTE47815.1 acetolactate synthase large subunit [Actinobaculum sp. 352]